VPVAVAKAQVGVDHLPRDDAEGAVLAVEAMRAHRAEQAKVERGGELAEARLLLSLAGGAATTLLAELAEARLLLALAAAEHDLVSGARVRVELRNRLGRILQVAVHHHRVLPGALGKPGGDRRVLAEVAAQAQAAHSRVLLGKPADHTPGAVRRAVIDQNDLVALGARLQYRRQAPMQHFQA